MGCRPSKRATSKIRDAREGSQCTCMDSSLKCNSKPKCSRSEANSSGSRRKSNGTESGSHGNYSNRGSSCQRTRSQKSNDTEFPAFSTTTAVYRRSASKASKITLRLSSDGSTLEIEKCDYDIVKSPPPQPQEANALIMRHWKSAPSLSAKALSPILRIADIHLRPACNNTSSDVQGALENPDEDAALYKYIRPVFLGINEQDTIKWGKIPLSDSKCEMKNDQCNERLYKGVILRKLNSDGNFGNRMRDRFSHPVAGERVDYYASNRIVEPPKNAFDTKSQHSQAYNNDVITESTFIGGQKRFETDTCRKQHLDRCTASLRSFNSYGRFPGKDFQIRGRQHIKNEYVHDHTIELQRELIRRIAHSSDKDISSPANNDSSGHITNHLKKINQRASIPRYDCFTIQDYNNIQSQSSTCVSDSIFAKNIGENTSVEDGISILPGSSTDIPQNLGNPSSRDKLTDREKLVLNLSPSPSSIDSTIISTDTKIISLVGRRDEYWHSHDHNLISARTNDRTLISFLNSPRESDLIRSFVELGCPLSPLNNQTDIDKVCKSTLHSDEQNESYNIAQLNTLKMGDSSNINQCFLANERDLNSHSNYIPLYENLSDLSDGCQWQINQSFDQEKVIADQSTINQDCSSDELYDNVGVDYIQLNTMEDSNHNENIDLKVNHGNEMKYIPLKCDRSVIIQKQEGAKIEPKVHSEAREIIHDNTMEQKGILDQLDDNFRGQGGKNKIERGEGNGKRRSDNDVTRNVNEVHYWSQEKACSDSDRFDPNKGINARDEVVEMNGHGTKKETDHGQNPPIPSCLNQCVVDSMEQNSLTKEELNLNAAIQNAFNAERFSPKTPCYSRTQSLPLLCYNNSFGECFPLPGRHALGTNINIQLNQRADTLQVDDTKPNEHLINSTEQNGNITAVSINDGHDKINKCFHSKASPASENDEIHPSLIEPKHAFQMVGEKKAEEKIDNGLNSHNWGVSRFPSEAVDKRGFHYSYPIKMDVNFSSVDKKDPLISKAGFRYRSNNENSAIVVASSPSSRRSPITDNVTSTGIIDSVLQAREVDINGSHDKMNCGDEKAQGVDEIAREITTNELESRFPHNCSTTTGICILKMQASERQTQLHNLQIQILNSNILNCFEKFHNSRDIENEADKHNILLHDLDENNCTVDTACCDRKLKNNFKGSQQNTDLHKESVSTLNVNNSPKENNDLLVKLLIEGGISSTKSVLHAKYALTHARTSEELMLSTSPSRTRPFIQHIIDSTEFQSLNCNPIGDSPCFVTSHYTNDIPDSSSDNIDDLAVDSSINCQYASTLQCHDIKTGPITQHECKNDPSKSNFPNTGRQTCPSTVNASGKNNRHLDSSPIESSPADVPFSSTDLPIHEPSFPSHQKSQLLTSNSSDSLSYSVSSYSLSNTLHSDNAHSDTILSDSFNSDTSNSDTPANCVCSAAAEEMAPHCHNSELKDSSTNYSINQPQCNESHYLSHSDVLLLDDKVQSASYTNNALFCSQSSQSNSPPSTPHSTLSPQSSSPHSERTLSPYYSPSVSPSTIQSIPFSNSDGQFQNLNNSDTFQKSQTCQSFTGQNNSVVCAWTQNLLSPSSSPSLSLPSSPLSPPPLPPPPDFDPDTIMESGLLILAPPSSIWSVLDENSKRYQKHRTIDPIVTGLNPREHQNSLLNPVDEHSGNVIRVFENMSSSVSSENGNELKFLESSSQGNYNETQNRTLLYEEGEETVLKSECIKKGEYEGHKITIGKEKTLDVGIGVWKKIDAFTPRRNNESMRNENNQLLLNTSIMNENDNDTYNQELRHVVDYGFSIKAEANRFLLNGKETQRTGRQSSPDQLSQRTITHVDNCDRTSPSDHLLKQQYETVVCHGENDSTENSTGASHGIVDSGFPAYRESSVRHEEFNKVSTNDKLLSQSEQVKDQEEDSFLLTSKNALTDTCALGKFNHQSEASKGGKEYNNGKYKYTDKNLAMTEPQGKIEVRVLSSLNEAQRLANVDSSPTKLQSKANIIWQKGNVIDDSIDRSSPVWDENTASMRGGQMSKRKTGKPKRNVQLLVKHFETVSVLSIRQQESLAQEKFAFISPPPSYPSSDA